MPSYLPPFSFSSSFWFCLNGSPQQIICPHLSLHLHPALSWHVFSQCKIGIDRERDIVCMYVYVFVHVCVQYMSILTYLFTCIIHSSTTSSSSSSFCTSRLIVDIYYLHMDCENCVCIYIEPLLPFISISWSIFFVYSLYYFAICPWAVVTHKCPHCGINEILSCLMLYPGV